MNKLTLDTLEDEIQEYEFINFKKADIESPDIPLDYVFENIQDTKKQSSPEHQKLIKNELVSARANNFNIAPIVKEHRGIHVHMLNEKKAQIDEAVDKRILLLQEQAYQKGFEQGSNDGREEVFRQTKAASEEKIQHLMDMVEEVLAVKHELLKIGKDQVYEVVKTLVKWITLRELTDDGAYIERLTEKLILELQTRSNLLIHVNQSYFDKMPEILETIEKKLGELTNVRVELDQESDLPGIVVQSENGILNGRLEAQFKNLDKLFQHVGLPFGVPEIDEPELPAVEPEILSEPKAEPEEVVGAATETEEEAEDLVVVDGTAMDESEVEKLIDEKLEKEANDNDEDDENNG